MIKLKEVINQLDPTTFGEIEAELVRSKAKNFHTLLTGLRNNVKTEKQISEELEISSSAFYALKSRLMDKIQERLSSITTFEREELARIRANIPELCNNTPREMANAILLKLENDLIQHGMHNELLDVYSALKRINIHTPKYFTYSQLFNKSVAYSLSLEKAEEISCEFSRIMSAYIVSKNTGLPDQLLFLRKEINNVFSLNASRQISIIQNLIIIQHSLFALIDRHDYENIETLLRESETMASAIPDKVMADAYLLVIHQLAFEYFFRAGKLKMAEEYYEKILPHQQHLLLHNHKSVTFTFLHSKLLFCLATNRKQDLSTELQDLVFDPDDQYAQVMLDYYKAMVFHIQGNTKKAISLLNQMINQYSLPNMFHMEVEVKLALSYFHYLQKDLDMADTTLKKLIRKIKADYSAVFPQMDYFAKFLDLVINKEDNPKIQLRKKESFTLFMAGNKDVHAVALVLIPELKALCQI